MESHTHSFVIKIWLEETAEEAGQAVWRGQITHVPSGKHQFVDNLYQFPLIIAPYLQELGVKSRFLDQVSQVP